MAQVVFLFIHFLTVSKFPKTAGGPSERNLYSKKAFLLLNIIDYFGVCFQL